MSSKLRAVWSRAFSRLAMASTSFACAVRDRGGRRPDRLPDGFELRLGAADGERILVGLDAEQDRAGLHALIGADADLDHPAADFGAILTR